MALLRRAALTAPFSSLARVCHNPCFLCPERAAHASVSHLRPLHLSPPQLCNFAANSDRPEAQRYKEYEKMALPQLQVRHGILMCPSHVGPLYHRTSLTFICLLPIAGGKSRDAPLAGERASPQTLATPGQVLRRWWRLLFFS